MVMTSQPSKILTLDTGAINELNNVRREMKGKCDAPAYKLTQAMLEYVHWLPRSNFTKVIDREGKIYSTRQWKRDIWPVIKSRNMSLGQLNRTDREGYDSISNERSSPIRICPWLNKFGF